MWKGIGIARLSSFLSKKCWKSGIRFFFVMFPWKLFIQNIGTTFWEQSTVCLNERNVHLRNSLSALAFSYFTVVKRSFTLNVLWNAASGVCCYGRVPGQSESERNFKPCDFKGLGPRGQLVLDRASVFWALGTLTQFKKKPLFEKIE